ncbi:hypothetical protein ACFPRL_03195 [Pseudoclavibacter helvolus]
MVRREWHLKRRDNPAGAASLRSSRARTGRRRADDARHERPAPLHEGGPPPPRPRDHRRPLVRPARVVPLRHDGDQPDLTRRGVRLARRHLRAPQCRALAPGSQGTRRASCCFLPW